MESKVVRLNKACIKYIDKIRDTWISGFDHSKISPNKSIFTDTYIIRLSLSEYAHYLENDKEDV